MRDRKVLVARMISAVSFVLVGSVAQIVLWKVPDGSYLDAFSHWSFLWIIYLLIGHIDR